MNPACDQLIAQLHELESMLEREYSAIRQRDLVRVETLTSAKQNLIDDLNRTVAEMGDALSDLLNADPSTTAQTIRASIARCAKANKTNGCAIESSQSFTASLLDVLRGRTPGERTYTSRGRLGAGTASSVFGHA